MYHWLELTLFIPVPFVITIRSKQVAACAHNGFVSIFYSLIIKDKEHKCDLCILVGFWLVNSVFSLIIILH